jgi:hypothetical protein
LQAILLWNDDEIAGNSGFPFHGYRNIEIDTYVMAWWPMRMISVHAVVLNRAMCRS